jgi:hypothetical protein
MVQVLQIVAVYGEPDLFTNQLLKLLSYLIHITGFGDNIELKAVSNKVVPDLLN